MYGGVGRRKTCCLTARMRRGSLSRSNMGDVVLGRKPVTSRSCEERFGVRFKLVERKEWVELAKEFVD